MNTHPYLKFDETGKVVVGCDKCVEDVVIPEGVTSIRYLAFRGCSSLRSIEIPDSVKSIGWCAFRGCSNLKSIRLYNENPSELHLGIFVFSGIEDCTLYVSFGRMEAYRKDNRFKRFETHPYLKLDETGKVVVGCDKNVKKIVIPKGVTSIGRNAFSGFSSLTSIEIPNSVTSIGEGAFSGFSSLTSIEIPNSVTSIGKGAFSGCSSLTSIEIPNSMTNIEDWAFVHCSSLTSIDIPNSVIKIGEDAFSGCSSLKEVYVSESHPCFAIVDGVLYSKDLTRLIWCPTWKQGDFAISNQITVISGGAFSGCSSLTSIEIPNSVESIEGYAFSGCKSLTSIEIPDSVTSIGWEAFSGCSALKEVHSYIEDPSKVQIDRLSDFPSRYCTLYVPINTIQAYRTHKVFMCFEKIKPIHPYLKFDETGKVIDGIRKKVTGVVIPEGVTSIGDEASRECTFLTSIEIPDSVESIGNSAFSGCSSLTSIEIPNSVKSIWDDAFKGCIYEA